MIMGNQQPRSLISMQHDSDCCSANGVSTMPAKRDALSVKYDTTARHVLLTAIRGHQLNPRQPRAARVWVHSPVREYRDLDHGGRTASERAFQRSVYYQTWRQPINAGIPPTWAPDFQWGKVERRGRRYGRWLRIRLYLHGSGRRHVDRKLFATQQWRQDLGTWRSGGRRSVPGDRIDSNRRASA